MIKIKLSDFNRDSCGEYDLDPTIEYVINVRSLSYQLNNPIMK